jgi:uncharacterized repeat protein (TIGR03803 family)
MRRVALLSVAVLALASSASAEWKEKVLYSFQGLPDGAYPAGGVVFDQAGNLYGATTDGGSNTCGGIAQCGIVFQLRAPEQKGGPWSEHVLYVFKGVTNNDGETPAGSVIFDPAGNLYGTTAYGGTGGCILLGSDVGCGVVYQMIPPKTKGGVWTEKVIYSFQGGKDGYFPWGDLTFDTQGNLYGATQYGGGKGTTCDPLYQYCGTVFKLSPPKTKGGKWSEEVLYSFAGGTDGANPNGGLVLDSKGAIYGATHIGGYNCPQFQGVGCGTVFKLTLLKSGNWTEQILHRFRDGNDGAGPSSGLVFDGKGALYGTAGLGGSGNGFGVVFRLAKVNNGQWTEVIVHSFQGNDGESPTGGVTFDPLGNLYGTSLGGAYSRGNVFRLKPTGSKHWNFSVLYSLMGAPDGNHPTASLILDTAGNLFGTTQWGGTGTACQGGCGTVFEVSP